jgi:hypothetical protein
MAETPKPSGVQTSPYGFDGAEQILHDCIKSRKNASHYIIRLGLLPVNGLESKPKFLAHSSVQELYNATQSLKTDIADKYSADELESQINAQFINKVTQPLIDVYGDAVWGVPRSRLEQKKSDIYPEKLDISNKFHLSK